MKWIAFFTVLVSATWAHSAITDNTFRNSNDYYVWGALGFVNTGAHTINNGDGTSRSANISGLVALGADFEYMLDYDLGLAGTLRYYSTSEDIEDGEKLSLSVFSLGAQTRFHFPHKAWDLYLAPGLSFTSASIKYDDDKSEAGLTITPTITLGIALAITETIVVGVENHRIIGLGTVMNGEIISDYMLKGRFTF